jgi:nucleoside-diphosphate-sugar epimerase
MKCNRSKRSHGPEPEYLQNISTMDRGLVLLTGASGFIGFTVLVKALQQGYCVRAVVRTEAKAEFIRSNSSIHPYLPNLTFTIVTKFLVNDAFNLALQDVTQLIHSAGIFSRPDLDYKAPIQVNTQLIQLNLTHLTNLLHAAKSQHIIKRIFTTSSAGTLVTKLWDTSLDLSHSTILPIA